LFRTNNLFIIQQQMPLLSEKSASKGSGYLVHLAQDLPIFFKVRFSSPATCALVHYMSINR